MSRVGFVVAEDRAEAIKTAEQKYLWRRIAAWRFVTEAKEDIRVVDAIGEFRSLGPRTKIFRGLGFERRPDKAKWEELVAQKLAIWGASWERKSDEQSTE